MSSMCILSFVLPPDSGEKIGLESVTILTIIQFLQHFLKMLPENIIHVPKITIYFYTIMAISAASLIMSSFVLVLHNKSSSLETTMSKWFEKIVCEYLAHFLRVNSVRHDIESSCPNEINQKSYRNSVIRKVSLDEYGITKVSVYDNEDVTNEILVEMANIKYETHFKKWKFAAIVVDRLCLILVFLANSVSTFFIVFLQWQNFNNQT